MNEFPLDDQITFGKVHKPVNLISDRSVYYKGLWGLIFCLMPGGIIGLILVRISLQQAKDALESYKKAPQEYLESSYQLVLRGQKLAYIGLGIFIAEIVGLVGYMSMN